MLVKVQHDAQLDVYECSGYRVRYADVVVFETYDVGRRCSACGGAAEAATLTWYLGLGDAAYVMNGQGETFEQVKGRVCGAPARAREASHA